MQLLVPPTTGRRTELKTTVKEPESTLAPVKPPLMEVENVSFSYDQGKIFVLQGVSLSIFPKEVLALIGASGCGKSTLLKCLNRMHDLKPGGHTRGRITLHGKNILEQYAEEVRLKVGMVFQIPNPFPKTIFENVAWGPRINGFIGKKRDLEAHVEKCLRQANLFEEVKDKLHKRSGAMDLSGGQKQRLCIARTIAMEPDVLLMDEPCSALDPISTARIEDTIRELKESHPIVIVTHNMQQAARISDRTAYFDREVMSEPAKLVEIANTSDFFINPSSARARDYITGKFG